MRRGGGIHQRASAIECATLQLGSGFQSFRNQILSLSLSLSLHDDMEKVTQLHHIP